MNLLLSHGFQIKAQGIVTMNLESPELVISIFPAYLNNPKNKIETSILLIQN